MNSRLWVNFRFPFALFVFILAFTLHLLPQVVLSAHVPHIVVAVARVTLSLTLTLIIYYALWRVASFYCRLFSLPLRSKVQRLWGLRRPGWFFVLFVSKGHVRSARDLVGLQAEVFSEFLLQLFLLVFMCTLDFRKSFEIQLSHLLRIRFNRSGQMPRGTR